MNLPPTERPGDVACPAGAHKLTLQGDRSQISALGAFVESLAVTHHWPHKLTFQVHLALEELIVNALTHGRVDADTPVTVHVAAWQDGDHVYIHICDNGRAFNPLESPLPDTSSELDDRPIGGLGVYLAERVMDAMRYQRQGRWNLLELRKTRL